MVSISSASDSVLYSQLFGFLFTSTVDPDPFPVTTSERVFYPALSFCQQYHSLDFETLYFSLSIPIHHSGNGRRMNCCPKEFDFTSAPSPQRRSYSRGNFLQSNYGPTTWISRIRTSSASWHWFMPASPPTPSQTGTGHNRSDYWHIM